MSEPETTTVPRFRNLDGNVKTIQDFHLRAGPHEEFDLPGYDQAAHGHLAGFEWLNPPPEPEPCGDGGDDTGNAAVAAGRRSRRPRSDEVRARSCPNCHSIGAPENGCTDTWHQTADDPEVTP